MTSPTSADHGIDFDTELRRGAGSYDHQVGKWWLERCCDEAHRKAYRNIARHIKKNLKKTPQRIIDYACGSGDLLVELYRAFPEAEFIAIDGSEEMIEAANARLTALDPEAPERVEFWHSGLPNFELPRFNADLLVFCFPNICCDEDDQPYYDANGAQSKRDRRNARFLANAREKDPDEETCHDDPETLEESLIDAKVVSRNLRQLVHNKGHVARIEYANAPVKELTKLVRQRLWFEQGCLDKGLDGKPPLQLFKRKTCDYFPSEVILDVYHQTGDEGDKEGGYLISLLRAV